MGVAQPRCRFLCLSNGAENFIRHGKASLVRLLATIGGSTSIIGGATADVRFDPYR